MRTAQEGQTRLNGCAQNCQKCRFSQKKGLPRGIEIIGKLCRQQCMHVCAWHCLECMPKLQPPPLILNYPTCLPYFFKTAGSYTVVPTPHCHEVLLFAALNTSANVLVDLEWLNPPFLQVHAHEVVLNPSCCPLPVPEGNTTTHLPRE